MSKRKTHEEFVNELKETRPNIKISGKYENCNSKLKCLCTVDNYEWESTPTKIRLYGCPVCSGKIITPEIYSKRLKEVHGDDIVLLGGYKNITTRALHHCNIHNYDFQIYPYAALRGQGCRYCAKDKLRKAALKSKDEAVQKLYDMYGDEFELAEEYHGASEKHKFIHHFGNGNTHTFKTTFSLLYLGEKCPYCSNNKVLVGFNDIATTNPYVASLFKNQEETHKYVELSNHKTDFICPNCSNIVSQVIANVSKNGEISCPYCSDGISYPNKLMFNCLKQIENKFNFLEREYKPDWCKFKFKNTTKTGIYDIYFGINNRKYIVEMDGGFHKNPHIKSGLSLEDTIYIDRQKTQLAEMHGITVIRIDCAYPIFRERYEYIKNNILSSKLKDIINLQDISFERANEDSLQSLLLNACNLWNEGRSTQEIAEIISVNVGTAREYLKSGEKYGLCDYTKEENKYRQNIVKRVICLNTKEIFNHSEEAGKSIGLKQQCIHACCNGKCNSAGKIGDMKLVWAYLEDYNNMTEMDIQEKLLNAYPKKVVCLNNNLLFLTPKDASEWVGVSSSAVTKCCTKSTKSCGIDEDTKEPMHWMYYDEYIKNYDKSTLLLYGRLSA